MKQTLLTFKSGLLTKLLLSFTLLLAGVGNILADTTEGFEYASDGTTAISINSGNMSLTNGWSVVGNGIYTGYSGTLRLQTINARSGYCLYATGTNTSWIVCPVMVSGTVSFYIKRNDTNGYVKVGIATKTNEEFSISNDNFQTTSLNTDKFKNQYGEITVSLGSSPVYVAFLLNYAFMDDVTYSPYEGEVGVSAPTSFSTSSISFDSATLNWEAGGEESEWQIYVSTDEGEPNDNDEDIETVNTTSYSLDLEENTTYHAYVRAVVDTNNSAWVHTTFTTYEQYPTPTNLTASNYAGTGTGATISWTDGDGDTPTSWQLRYNTSDFSPAGGEGTLIDNIDGNTETLSGLTPGGTYYVSVRACYGEGLYSSWTDKISFTTIAAWETFSDGIPSTWYNDNNTWSTNRSGYEGMASASSATSNPLRTPRLYAEAGQTISFDVTVNSGSLTARYYKDSRSSYTTIGTYTTSGTQTFTASTSGYYWLQFSGYNCAIDNINGFGPSDTEHLMELGSNTMSSTGTVGGDYTARVNIRELGGTGETFTAELWYDGDKVAELEDQVIAGNRDMEVQITFTPMEENTSKSMYAKIIYDGGTKELTTATTNVTFSNTEYVLDENNTTRPESSVYSRVVQLKYAAKNGWNTICVPFILNETYLDQIFGSDWKAYAFSGYSDGAISFQKKSSSFVVSTPYLVYAENADKVDANKIYLKSASINTSNYSSANMTVTKNIASFIGTLDPKAKGTLEGKYGVTGDGHIAKGGSGAFMRGYRAYFSLPDAGVHSLVFDDEGGETDLGFLKMVDENAKDVYTLTGQKVQKGRKGIYIVNGKKVVIK